MLVITAIYKSFHYNSGLACGCQDSRFSLGLFVWFLGENPQSAAYSAQPLCWSDRETSSPTTHRGSSTERWNRNNPRVVTVKVLFLIIITSFILLIVTFTFDIVPPILNRGIQPATFPKALLVLIIFLTLLIV